MIIKRRGFLEADKVVPKPDYFKDFDDFFDGDFAKDHEYSEHGFATYDDLPYVNNIPDFTEQE